MEDANGPKSIIPTPPDNDDQQHPGRTRSSSASSGHKRTTSGSLLSRLSFLRMMQANQDNNPSQRNYPSANRDSVDELGPGLKGGKAMSTALQQHKRTRRRRGSLRKTALLGTRFEHRDKKISRTSSDVLRGEVNKGPQQLPPPRAGTFPVGSDMYPIGNQDEEESYENPRAWTFMEAPSRSAGDHSHLPLAKDDKMLGGETTDEEEIMTFPRVKNTNAAVAAALHNSSAGGNAGAAGLHLPTTASGADPYYALQADPAYRAIHRAKSPLTTHPADIAGGQELVRDYSETEWWGWIILIVTWIVFVVGMGSCFGVWSWAWDVGETPYAPPELEDDPTLPIVGYYPALIILTAVMSWVWVVVAWVGMKYFKHANISGDDI